MTTQAEAIEALEAALEMAGIPAAVTVPHLGGVPTGNTTEVWLGLSPVAAERLRALLGIGGYLGIAGLHEVGLRQLGGAEMPTHTSVYLALEDGVGLAALIGTRVEAAARGGVGGAS